LAQPVQSWQQRNEDVRVIYAVHCLSLAAHDGHHTVPVDDSRSSQQVLMIKSTAVLFPFGCEPGPLVDDCLIELANVGNIRRVIWRRDIVDEGSLEEGSHGIRICVVELREIARRVK